MDEAHRTDGIGDEFGEGSRRDHVRDFGEGFGATSVTGVVDWDAALDGPLDGRVDIVRFVEDSVGHGGVELEVDVAVRPDTHSRLASERSWGGSLEFGT